MIYYLLLPGDTEADTVNDTNILGEVSFKRFKKSGGLDVLIKITKERPDLIEQLRIYDEKSKRYTVDEFLNILEKHTNYK